MHEFSKNDVLTTHILRLNHKYLCVSERIVCRICPKIFVVYFKGYKLLCKENLQQTFYGP